MINELPLLYSKMLVEKFRHCQFKSCSKYVIKAIKVYSQQIDYDGQTESSIIVLLSMYMMFMCYPYTCDVFSTCWLKNIFQTNLKNLYFLNFRLIIIHIIFRA